MKDKIPMKMRKLAGAVISNTSEEADV